MNLRLFFIITNFEFRRLATDRIYIALIIISFLSGYLGVSSRAGIFGEEIFSPDGIANSPYAIYRLLTNYFLVWGFFIAYLSSVILRRENKNNLAEVFFSLPVSSSQIFCAKIYTFAFSAMLLLLLFIAGTIVSVIHPGLSQEFLVIPDSRIYIKLIILFVTPAALILLSIAALTSVSRPESHAPFIAVLIYFVLKEAARFCYPMVTDWPASFVLDFWGEFEIALQYAAISSREAEFTEIAITGSLILGRIVAVSYSAIMLLSAYFLYTPARLITPVNNPKIRSRKYFPGRIVRSQFQFFVNSLENIPVLKQFLAAHRLSGIIFTSIIRDRLFSVLIIIGFLLIILLLSQINNPYNLRLQSKTWLMLAFPMLFFSFFLNLITIFYTAVVIHRNRTHAMDGLVESTAASHEIRVLADLFTIIRIQLLLIAVLFISMVAVQVYSGTGQVDLQLYFISLISVHLVSYIVFLCLFYFIQSLADSFYPGIYISLGVWLSISQLEALGINSPIFRYNQIPNPGFFLAYSEMSGFGGDLAPVFLYRFYWSLFAVLLVITGIAISSAKREKLKFINLMSFVKSGYSRKKLFIPGLILSAFLLTGIFLYMEEAKINNRGNEYYKSSFISTNDSLLFNTPAPRIISKDISIDIYPESRTFNANGTYICVNKTKHPINHIVIRQKPGLFLEIFFDKNSQLILRDSIGEFSVYGFDKPINPEDTINLHFTLKSGPAGLLDSRNPVQPNGTYFTSELFPFLGIRENLVFNSGQKAEVRNHYRAEDADLIHLTINVSTSANQTALAPGILSKFTKANGRNNFTFTSPEKVTPEFAVISGIYNKQIFIIHDDTLEIYHHPEHDSNISNFKNGIAAAKNYLTKRFGDLKHSIIRIVEISRRNGSFAQSFNTLIPYSETGFILDIDNNRLSSINLPFLGAAHEYIHQWWGMRLIPLDAHGYKFLTESVTEYLAYKIYCGTFGDEAGKIIIQKAMEGYLAKSLESEMESPLSKVYSADDNFVAYHKGLIALRIAENYLGSESFLALLSSFFKTHSEGSPPYPMAENLLNEILTVMPDSVNKSIEEIFNKVVHFDAKFEIKESRKYDSNWKTNATIALSKLMKDNEGVFRLTEIQSEYIQLGLYRHSTKSMPDTIINLNLNTTASNIELQTSFKPAKIVLDPEYLMVLRNRRNLTKHY